MKLMFHRPRGYSRASPRWMQPRARFSKFVIQRGTLGNELRKPKGTSNSMILVPLFDLKFLKRTRGTRCRNFKSAALAHFFSHLHKRDVARCAQLPRAPD